jgi:hypothetical protein
MLVTRITCGSCGRGHRIHRDLAGGSRYRFICKHCGAEVIFSTNCVRWAFSPRQSQRHPARTINTTRPWNAVAEQPTVDSTVVDSIVVDNTVDSAAADITTVDSTTVDSTTVDRTMVDRTMVDRTVVDSTTTADATPVVNDMAVNTVVEDLATADTVANHSADQTRQRRRRLSRAEYETLVDQTVPEVILTPPTPPQRGGVAPPPIPTTKPHRDTMIDQRAPVHLTPLARRGVDGERESARVKWLRAQRRGAA